MMIRTLCLTALVLTCQLLASHAADAVSKKELEQRLQAVDKRVLRIEKLVDNQVLIDLLRRIEALQQELQQLRGDTERLQYELKGLKGQQRTLYLGVDQRLQQLEGGGVAAPGRQPGAPLPAPTAGIAAAEATSRASGGEQTAVATAPAPSAAPPSGGKSDREAYRDALNLLKDRRYDSSIAAFNAFLKNHPQSAYAGNAQYWLAEAHYAARKFQQAVKEYQKVINDYSASPKVADATLKLGFAYYELGDWAQARRVLTELGKKHPNSAVARLADKRLQQMKKEGH